MIDAKCSPVDAEIPLPLAPDAEAFSLRLGQQGLPGALAFLNARTPHRFTGVFRFDGETLRSVALVDSWDRSVGQGEDIPLAQAYCAVLHDTGEPLEVLDSRTDGRYPGMADSPVVSYCGVLIRDPDGQPWGALCHYDLKPCQTKSSDMPLLAAAAGLLYPHAASN